MTEIQNTEATEATAELNARFTPAYVEAETRVFRKRLRRTEGGATTVIFRGQVEDATTAWVKRGSRGISLYVEVTPDDTTATEITVAVVPTGKRPPLTGKRLGSVGGQHVYLIGVDGTIDRAAYDAASAARQAERDAEAAASDDGDDDGGGFFG